MHGRFSFRKIYCSCNQTLILSHLTWNHGKLGAQPPSGSPPVLVPCLARRRWLILLCHVLQTLAWRPSKSKGVEATAETPSTASSAWSNACALPGPATCNLALDCSAQTMVVEYNLCGAVHEVRSTKKNQIAFTRISVQIVSFFTLVFFEAFAIWVVRNWWRLHHFVAS